MPEDMSMIPYNGGNLDVVLYVSVPLLVHYLRQKTNVELHFVADTMTPWWFWTEIRNS